MTRVKVAMIGVLAGLGMTVGLPVLAVGAPTSASPTTINCQPISSGSYNPKPGVYTHRCTVISQRGMLVETFYG
ncbi:hypothetical protein [Gordonia sp. NPDC058843]|uniref:hypothetical protein n=1 Tax=Gordonia sp. NPDC058843 TaxID=3346648 RepID=UPI00369D020C